MKTFLLLIFCYFMIASSMLSAQVAINETGASPDAAAILDVSSTNKGVLLPRVDISDLSTVAPLSAPVPDGMLVYNTNAATGLGFFLWNGTTWIKVATLADINTGPQKMVFRAEYPGATLMADGTNNDGYMTSDNSGSTESWMNYYEWSANNFSLQDYDIVLRVTLPDDFLSWQTNAIVVDYQTDNAAIADGNFSAYIYEEASSTELAIIYGTASTTWATTSLSGSLLSSLTAGETFVIALKLSSRNNNAIRVGDVTLNFNK